MKQSGITERHILDVLAKYWGYPSLRGTQLSVIESVLRGVDTLALMPTGAGKSLTYQLPGLLCEGVCIVVTPLIALMKDQVDSLRRRGISAVSVHSGMSPRNIDITLENCIYGDVKFLYIAPERIASELFAARLAKMKVSLVAVDEAHCISQWGYDFRPAYLRISRIREIVPDVPILALTASATERVADDIVDKLGMREPRVVRSDFSRPNLSFAVRATDDKAGQLMRILQNVPGSGIIYMRTRDGAEILTRQLREAGVSADYYHAGLPHGERAVRQNSWTSGATRVMVATTAFGMGIDKPDVRFVVHYDVPGSLEEYYQEAGRAGRDGRRSYAVLLAASDDKEKVTRRFEAEFPTMEQVRDIYVKLFDYLGVAVGDGKNFAAAFNIHDFCARNRIFSGLVHNTLKLLQQNGYIVFSDNDENPARLMFCVSRDDLYSLRVERDDLDNILRTILRLYTGVFSDFRSIDTQEMAIYTGYDEARVKELLKTLWQLHVIRYIPRNLSPMIFMLDDRLPIKDLYISPQTLALRKEMTGERLKAMVAYVENSSECRAVVLQRHFGQRDAAPCGICDHCLAERRRDEDASPKLRRTILDILAAEPLSLKCLVGRFACPAASVVAAVDALVAEGVISVDKGGIVAIIR